MLCVNISVGFDQCDNQFVDRQSSTAGQWQCHHRFRAVSQCRRTHGPRVASIPGITRTAVIMSPSNVLLNTLASLPYIFNRCESQQRTIHVYWKLPGGCRKKCPDVSIEIIKREISGMPVNIYSTAKVPFSKILVLLKLSLCYLIKSNRRITASVTLKTNSLGNSVSGATFA